MKKDDVLNVLNDIFVTVLNKKELRLDYSMSTDDIDEWDSLTNMTIISEIEKHYSIHFKLRDIIKMRNVGDMVDVIIKKSQE
nr:acyl carrier protein [Prevotella sp.]